MRGYWVVLLAFSVLGTSASRDLLQNANGIVQGDAPGPSAGATPGSDGTTGTTLGAARRALLRSPAQHPSPYQGTQESVNIGNGASVGVSSSARASSSSSGQDPRATGPIQEGGVGNASPLAPPANSASIPDAPAAPATPSAPYAPASPSPGAPQTPGTPSASPAQPGSPDASPPPASPPGPSSPPPPPPPAPPGPSPPPPPPSPPPSPYSPNSSSSPPPPPPAPSQPPGPVQIASVPPSAPSGASPNPDISDNPISTGRVKEIPGSSTYTGDGTAFSAAVDNSQASKFACGLHHLDSWASKYFVAMNNAQWNDGLACGRCVKARCVDSKCPIQGQEILAKVVDKCPECSEGDLDFSYPAYSLVTGSWPNRLKVSWEWADCSPFVDGNISIYPKDGGSQYWQAFFFANARYPIAQASVNGEPLQRQTFGFWTHSGNVAPGSTLQLVSETGQTISATLNAPFQQQDLGVQFAAVPTADLVAGNWGSVGGAFAESGGGGSGGSS